jgi:hypothetical protein
MHETLVLIRELLMITKMYCFNIINDVIYIYIYIYISNVTMLIVWLVNIIQYSYYQY